jgi:hypothetical protein
MDYCRQWRRHPPVEVRVRGDLKDFSLATVEELGGGRRRMKRGGEGVATAVGGRRWSGPEKVGSMEARWSRRRGRWGRRRDGEPKKKTYVMRRKNIGKERGGPT